MYTEIKSFSMLMLAQQIFYDVEHKKDTIIISIQEPPEGNGFIFTPTGRVQDVLTLMFEDIDPIKYPVFNREELEQYTTMTIQQAKQIIEFVKQYEDNSDIKNIWIHCHAGVARSGAIAHVLQEYYHLPQVEEGSSVVVLNYHVYYTIAALLGLSYNCQLLSELKVLDEAETKAYELDISTAVK